MNSIIFFDLDGTLTESGLGITRCVQYALEKLGRPEPSLEKLRVFIGPPLIDMFQKYAHLNEADAKRGVHYYRERYNTIGIFENQLYPGIRELLQALDEAGCILAITSAKPEPYVRQIADYFTITPYFDEIVGSTMQETRTKKPEVIVEAMRRLHLSDPEAVTMVGDRADDIQGAKTVGTQSVGVLYGYGTPAELHEADALVMTPADLKQFLLEKNLKDD